MILPPPPSDAGPDVSLDASDVSDVFVEDSQADAVAPEDPTGDAGEAADAAIYNEGDPGLPSSPAGDNTGCECTTHRARVAAPFGGLVLAIALAVTRRAVRRRA